MKRTIVTAKRAPTAFAWSAMALIDLLTVEVPKSDGVAGRYDEARSLTLDVRGVPLVAGPSGETREITEVSGERDDPPPREPPPGRDEETRTFVERESDELSEGAFGAMRT